MRRLYSDLKMETKEDVLRWRMHFNFREKLIKEVVAKQLNLVNNG